MPPTVLPSLRKCRFVCLCRKIREFLCCFCSFFSLFRRAQHSISPTKQPLSGPVVGLFLFVSCTLHCLNTHTRRANDLLSTSAERQFIKPSIRLLQQFFLHIHTVTTHVHKTCTSAAGLRLTFNCLPLSYLYVNECNIVCRRVTHNIAARINWTTVCFVDQVMCWQETSMQQRLRKEKKTRE